MWKRYVYDGPGPCLSAVQNWGPYLKLGFGSTMMMCLEWWLFEFANMLSGILPDPQASLAVTGVCMQIIALAFMVPLGICGGLRIRVANLLGVLPTATYAGCWHLDILTLNLGGL